MAALPFRPNFPSPEKPEAHRRAAGAVRSQLLLRGGKGEKSTSYSSLKSYDQVIPMRVRT
ncbi:rCG44896 [Rattus norvegicus]|uniref:RCG44896 n=1 Tax=Rattus norvegicus TaxID=10116 RepID=A6KJZ8_RAT|nr:rCG44896 [Rattus norvegicus]